jgi:co-chaperonin GroES (HSP10)
MNIIPLKANVIIERIKKDEMTAGGIVLPGGDRDEADRATVIAIGPEVTSVQVGDEVLVNWNKTSGFGEDKFRVAEEEIIGIFED